MFDWFPQNISTFGGDIDSVFWLIFYIVGAGFILGEAVIIYCAIRYRRKAGRRAAFITGEKMSELAWVMVPAAIVLILDFGIEFAGGEAWSKVKGETPASDIKVIVTGKQFNWNFTYPGPDGTFGTDDDLLLENELHVPVRKVVDITIKSEDVLHSFFVPVMRLKQDAIPGRSIPAWFEATATGQYEIGCAELCGYGHYTMRGFLFVHTAEDYAKWIQERWPPAAPSADSTNVVQL
ncbi:MAG: Alternative cytochrome c oxidase subunit 2 [bacterium]|nr:Alternative cytochrome c oxidase subunit 2 [bacterium]